MCAESVFNVIIPEVACALHIVAITMYSHPTGLFHGLFYTDISRNSKEIEMSHCKVVLRK